MSDKPEERKKKDTKISELNENIGALFIGDQANKHVVEETTKKPPKEKIRYYTPPIEVLQNEGDEEGDYLLNLLK